MTGSRNKRPVRLQVLDQFGHPKSLPDNPEQFQLLHAAEPSDGVLLLGIGPNPLVVADMLQGNLDVVYMECPELLRQLPPEHKTALPAHWKAVSPQALDNSQMTSRTLFFYRPGLVLYPDFWAPVLARITHKRCPPTTLTRNIVWLPSSEGRLLTRELSWAFSATGLVVRLIPEAMAPDEIARRLRDECPYLFFSINFRGLDPHGLNYELLHALGVQVCVWCVDNPFHLLSGLKSAYWRQCRLFVTDDWFIPLLSDYGGNRVTHLPLAAAEHFFDPDPPTSEPQDWPELGDKIVFVGRSAFPSKKSYFAGCSVPGHLEQAARTLMDQGDRPDFSWWWRKLSSPVLWPGKTVRRVGFAAEECNRRRRTEYLRRVGRVRDMTIFGDSDWKKLLPELADIRPEVDYYGSLALIYRQARITLNLTSLLLPHGLTQRHFDVWAAGGFLLTDSTPGMAIFNQKLAGEISFTTRESMAVLARRLDTDPGLNVDLRYAWQRHIQANHRYVQRVSLVLETVAMTT